MQRRWVKVVLGVLVLLLLVVVLLPLFVNANTFRPTIEAQLSTSLGRKVTLGNLSFSLLSGSLVAQNVTIADDPAYSAAPFLQAKSLHIGVVTSELIFHRQVQVTKFVADSPVIHLIHGADGRWNYSSLSGKAGSNAAQQAPTSQQQGNVMPGTKIGEVQITNGTVEVATQPATNKPLVYSNVDLTVQPLDLAAASPFKLTASLPGEGSVAVNGKFGPIAPKDLSDTPMNANLDLKHFDPVAAGVVDPSKGITMVADVQARLASDGTTLTSTGTVHANHLQLVRSGAPAPNPADIDYTVSENLDARTGTISDLAIKTGSVAAHVTGTYRFTPQAVVLDLKLNAPNLPIDQLEALLPAFGVRLPSGSTLRGGTLTANLTITGPATATDIRGPVEVDNTELTGFNLGAKIQGLAGGGGAPNGATAIQTLRAEVNTSAQETQLNNIYGLVPAIGSATGSGTVSPGGALNFHLLAKLNTKTGVGEVANVASAAIGGLLGNVVHTAASSGIPISISGTTANPSIHADLGSMFKQTAQPGQSGQKPVTAGTVLNSLFGGH